MHDLVRVVQQYNIHSLAIPALGCSNGGLDWNEVRPLIETACAKLSDVHILLYAPSKTPDSKAMPLKTVRPNMTPGRAAIIGLMSNYAIPGYTLTRLEIQKLAYFLQEAGEPLRLTFVKHLYGPYAENLHHVLQYMEGHFIRGYGDRGRPGAISLLDGIEEEAERFLSNYPDTQQRFVQVSHLIEGFEFPYGMELLATIHWLACYENPAVHDDPDAAIQGVSQWNERKRKTFCSEHIRMTWNRLHEQGWIGNQELACGQQQEPSQN